MFAAAAGMVFLLAACESSTLAPTTSPTPEPSARAGNVLAVIACSASRTTLTVNCGAQPARTGASADLIVGGQNVFVRLASSNFSYNAGTGQYVFDVTLQNLIPQSLGTTDGVTVDPSGVRVFFNSGPTVTSGSGSVAVVPDGFATFTAAGQAYYTYPQLIARDEVSAARTWTMIMPPTVTTFAFTLYVSAPVQFPIGYIDLTPGMTTVHPGDLQSLTAVRRGATGNALSGSPALSWSTSDPSVATVDTSGAVTPIRGGPVVVSVTDGTRLGVMPFTVTGMTRVWNGSVSTDFDVAGNWDAAGPTVPAAVPMSMDSILVQAGAPVFPHLSTVTSLAGVTVTDNASLSLDAFDLVATGDVSTTALGRITATTGSLTLAGLTHTVGGVLPRLLVTGTYALAANLTCTELTVRNGMLTSASFEVLQTP